MKIGFSPESIVGLDGMPLVGRVTLFAHDSDTAIKVYTLEGDTFVQAENPQLLNNAGRLDNTLFFESAIVDVLVEKYVGAEGMMSVDSPDSDFETFDSFEIGLDTSSIEGAETVDTIAQLMDSDPSKKFVNVMGYYAVGDCAPRLYYWDADSVNDIDGGYVVGSNVEDSGRWILLWGDEVIPSSVYGIVPGTNETNINAFLNYPDSVGSFYLKTAPCARFVSGTYSSNVGFATSKQLMFDNGAKFPYANFICNSIRVLGVPTSYVADFKFNSRIEEVHSSWFRKLESFLTCGASRLVVDRVNYFENSNLYSLVTLDRVTLEYSENTRLPITYVGNGRIKLSNVNVVGKGIFNEDDKVTFLNMKFRDSWFSQDGSEIDFADNVVCRSVSGNVIRIANFNSVEAYINAVKNDGRLSIDLENRFVHSISATSFIEIKNASCDILNIHNSGNDVVLSNIHCDSLIASCRYLDIVDCSVKFSFEPSLSKLYSRNSDLDSDSVWQNGTVQVTCERCRVGISFMYGMDDNVSSSQVLRFTDCDFARNTVLYAKKLEMFRCVTDNTSIKLYPYKENGNYYLHAIFEGNCFNSNVPVQFTKYDTVEGAVDEDCYNVLLNVKIVGNTFLGNSEGVKMRYWQNRGGTYSGRTFIKETSTGHEFEYSGNAGNCPAESMAGVSVGDNVAYTTYALDGGTLYKYISSWKRVAVNPNASAVWWYSMPVGGTSTCIKYYNRVHSPYDSLTYEVFYQDVCYYMKARDLSVGADNGDYFSLCVGTINDYIRIVQSGDNDKNTGVVARIV